MSTALAEPSAPATEVPAPPAEHDAPGHDPDHDELVEVGRATPALTPTLFIVRGVLITVAVLCGAFLFQLVVVSGFQHTASQQESFRQFREELALGTIELGPTFEDGDWLPLGSPVARLDIPRIDVEEIVGSGTDAQTLYLGPGHRRDTPLPGQQGTSVLMGRRAAYGGPFGAIADLEPGDEIEVTTAQGTFDFVVSGTRSGGDPIPPLPNTGAARLTLVTASGPPFMPSGTVYVDADLVGTPVVGTEVLFAPDALPSAEGPNAIDTTGLWVLALWLQAVLLISLIGVWSWHRWHQAKTWIALAPLLALVGLAAAGELTRLLPNLL